MAEVKWSARRISDGVLVDVTGDTDGTPLTAPTPNPLEAGGPGGGGVTVDNQSDPPAEVTTLIAPGAVVAGDEATLGKWTLEVGDELTADLSISATANSPIIGGGEALANRSAIATGLANAQAHTVASSVEGDAEANTTVTVAGVQDANAKTTVTTIEGNADITRRAEVTSEDGGDAFANTLAKTASGGTASAKTEAQNDLDGDADAYNSAIVIDGAAQSGGFATATGDGDATAYNDADVAAAGGGTATARSTATSGPRVAGMVAEADSTSARIGFFNATPVARPTGVAVTAGGIHAALVSLGLIEA